MKKLFATAASVLVLGLASSAMAQNKNTSISSQTGQGSQGHIEQIQGTAGTQNDSYLHQNGNYNYAKAMQSGSDDIVNDSEITQIGNGNYANVDQNGSGDNDLNYSSVVQQGHGNSATVKQGDIRNDNKSWIAQLGNNNIASVTQDGNAGSNTSYVNQFENNDHAVVVQGGDGAVNTSTITQDLDAGVTTAGNYAEVRQGERSNNESILAQYGDANAAYVTQGAGSTVTNYSNATQNGTSNYLNVKQH
jgi:hypothetical protein